MNFKPLQITLVSSFMLLAFTFVNSNAQSFDDGLKAYNHRDYEKALSIFQQNHDQQHRLFTGKTLFNLNRLHEARFILLNALNGDDVNFTGDALYTLSLIYLIEQNPAKSLDYLSEISTLENVKGNLKENAALQFRIINSFLSFKERLDVLKYAEYSQSLIGVLEEGLRIESKKDAATLFSYATTLHQGHFINDNDFNRLQTNYLKNRQNSRLFTNALPAGYSYTIGVLLPTEDKTSPLFSVSRDIYSGLRTAVEEHNISQSNGNIFLKFLPIPDTSNVIANLWMDESVDVVIGPLTSENAGDIVSSAEDLSIPLIAPLANNDSLNIDNPFFYQLNPTFKTRGKMMAQYALKSMKVDTVAIMVDVNTMGYISALAFKEEMEINKKHVAYFFAEPFESTAFDISEFTKVFTSDTLLIDSLRIPKIDVVYMPFTGEQSETLIDLTLTDLEAGKSSIPILGSQDWGYIELTPERLRRFTIYYPDAITVKEDDPKVIQFRQHYYDLNNGEEPSIYSFTGYDLGTYLSEIFSQIKNPLLLKSALTNKGTYHGLANQIKFGSSHINQSLSIYKMDKNGVQLVK